MTSYCKCQVRWTLIIKRHEKGVFITFYNSLKLLKLLIYLWGISFAEFPITIPDNRFDMKLFIMQFRTILATALISFRKCCEVWILNTAKSISRNVLILYLIRRY